MWPLPAPFWAEVARTIETSPSASVDTPGASGFVGFSTELVAVELDPGDFDPEVGDPVELGTIEVELADEEDCRAAQLQITETETNTPSTHLRHIQYPQGYFRRRSVKMRRPAISPTPRQ